MQRVSAQRNLFPQIDRVFRPNNGHDTTRRKVYSTKNILQGDTAFAVIKNSQLERQQSLTAPLHHSFTTTMC